jgi:hypothetical protein
MAENSENTRRRGPGRPWGQGQSGNPGGRPKKDPVLLDVLKGNTEKAVKRLVELIDSYDERIALSAVNSLLDRVWGRAETSGQLALTDINNKNLFPRDIRVRFINSDGTRETMPRMGICDETGFEE